MSNETEEFRPFNPGDGVLIKARLDGIAYFTGELVHESAYVIVVKRCTWHRQTGRHSEFTAGADSTEREAYPAKSLVRFERHSVVMVSHWAGNLDAGTA